ncbi:MAG: hypothetical protein ACK4EY_15175 [Flavipsychrobacter sp.]
MGHQLNQDEKKTYAEQLYMRGDIDQKDIARLVGVSEVTMSKWVNDDVMNWKAKRKSFLVTKQEIVRRLYNVIEKITIRMDTAEDGGDTKEADKLIKYTAALRNLETETSIREIMDVSMKFGKWLLPIDPKMASTVSDYMDKFIKEKLKRF